MSSVITDVNHKAVKQMFVYTNQLTLMILRSLRTRHQHYLNLEDQPCNLSPANPLHFFAFGEVEILVNLPMGLHYYRFAICCPEKNIQISILTI